jgi:ribonuclease Z
MASMIFRRMMGIALFAIALLPAAAQAQEIKVTLLGTGCPPAVMDRFGPSILVEAGGQKFIFDAGRGALQRLNQINVPWRNVNGVFLTHLHSDHVVGFPDVADRLAYTGAGSTATGVGAERDEAYDVASRAGIRVRHPNSTL